MGYTKPLTWAKIKPSIFLTGQAPQTDPLTNLPAELGQIVWDNIENDTDKTALALTCKANADFHESLKKPKRAKIHKKLDKVRFMKRIRGFSGTGKTRLCFKCTKYMPVRGEWGGRSGYDRLIPAEVHKHHLITGPRCPRCIKNDKLEQLRYMDYSINKVIGGNRGRKNDRKGACKLARQRAVARKGAGTSRP